MARSRAGASTAGPAPASVRRSARIGSTGSVAQSVATTTTPSRTPARKGTLPQVKARESQAYGSSGRIGVVQPIPVPETGFTQGLDALRDNAAARDDARQSNESDEYGSTDELHSPRFHGTGPQVPTVPSRQSSESVDSRESLIPTTSPHFKTPAHIGTSPAPSLADTTTSKSFGIEREAGLYTTSRTSQYTATNGLTQRRNHVTVQSTRLGPTPPEISRYDTPPGASQINPRGPTRPPQRTELGTRPTISQTRNTAPRGGPLYNGSAANNIRRGFAQNNPEHEENRAQGDNASAWNNITASANHVFARLRDTFAGLGALKTFIFLLLASLLTIALIRPRSGMSGAIATRLNNSYHQTQSWIAGHPRPKEHVHFDREGNPIPGHPDCNFVWSILTRRAEIVQDKTDALEKSLEEFKLKLPPMVLVNKRPDGTTEIPDEFWRAILSKMKATGMPDLTQSANAQWNEFLDKNHANILRSMSDLIQNSELKESFEVIARDKFVTMMTDEYGKLSTLIDKKVAEAVKAVSKNVAKDIANKAYQDQIRLQSLAFANLVANAEIGLRKVNYFSTGLGARIDPFLTSSTFVRETSLSTKAYNKLFAIPGRRPPVAALEKWDEPGECWCAAPDDKGKGLAQLSVSLAQKMIPRQVTVEHLPKQASLDFTSAPKDMEIWAETDEWLQNRADCSGEAPQLGWKCLGKFSYNVHADNHVQTFNLDFTLTKPVAKTIVRVNNNWGSDHTCLYRVRLHGAGAETE